MADITELKELKTGHIIKTRNGRFYMLFKGDNVFGLADAFIGLSDDTNYLLLADFALNLKRKNDDEYEWDIVKVYKPDFSGFHTRRDKLRCLAHTVLNWPNDLMDNVYKESTKKLTVSEISKLLGYPVEIVEEHKSED